MSNDHGIISLVLIPFDCYNRKKTNLKLKEEGSMISDFIGAAAPWVTMGLFIAIICSFMSKKSD